MKTKILFISIVAFVAMILTAGSVSAQQSYNWTKVKRGGWVKPKSIPVNWLPERDSIAYPYQRHTVAFDFGKGVYSGFKFDYEYELPGRPGEWISAGLTGYHLPVRKTSAHLWLYPDRYGNNRYGPASGWDDFKQMWGIGGQVMYKRMLHRRGWYFATGVEIEFFSVGIGVPSYDSFKQDGLTFYTRGHGKTKDRSYLKPSAVFVFGKHFALGRRCFLDMYFGVKYSYSIYKPDPHTYSYYDSYYGETISYSYEDFDTMGGFAYRGFSPHGGIRFGVLLWKRK